MAFVAVFTGPLSDYLDDLGFFNLGFFTGVGIFAAAHLVLGGSIGQWWSCFLPLIFATGFTVGAYTTDEGDPHGFAALILIWLVLLPALIGGVAAGVVLRRLLVPRRRAPASAAQG